ncbi:murein L,D-transpeptidase [Sphingomonas parva]|uniref:Murein L,D-transpeptidase n=1 Tax=Sphingomonas parva TaxID=2555898 RepID=A0A4Y8ZYQ4_9SPHN|nr:L,D-transpeptidase family protein [Sphingomonas parva]TFI59776.1 murein L,D-transpeptidase [Sphingomonas parva]
MRGFIMGVSLVALAASGCGDNQGGNGSQSVAVEPKQVTAAELQAAVTDERVRRFYELRQWQPAWTDESAQDLTAALGDAGRHAIDVSSFTYAASQAGSPAEREARLTLAAIEYASALATGATDPRNLWEVYTVPMNRVDVVEGLQQAAAQGTVSAWLAALASQDAEYKALSEAYVSYKQRAGEEARAPIPSGKKIEIGSTDPRVLQIVDALRSNGYLAAKPAEQGDRSRPASVGGSAVYTREIAEGVKRLQAEYGIKPDGVIGDEALEALNTGPVQRARILAVNLERRRWLQRQPPATRIDVNTAATVLDYWRDGEHGHRAKVVVGQPGWETPQLGSPITRLVANPPWTVPESIAQKEVLPKGAAYMRRENMTMKDRRIVQAPGPNSALGLVKFDMDNPHAIYLHDTPAKALFARQERHASHGCARVENAIGFARLLAQYDGKLDAFNKALATGEETGVPLSRAIPVRFLYHTAYFDGSRVVFLHDDYGWDDKVAKSLGIRGELRRHAKAYPTDVGP